MSESPNLILMFAYVGGFGLSLLSLLVLLTISFSKLKKIEDLIAGPERSISKLRYIWGNRPYGRLIRSSYITAFLIMRNIPLPYFQRSAAVIGDPKMSVPLSLRIWAIAPPLGMFLGLFIIFIGDQFHSSLL